jgi:hypothetical protein
MVLTLVYRKWVVKFKDNTKIDLKEMDMEEKTKIWLEEICY